MASQNIAAPSPLSTSIASNFALTLLRAITGFIVAPVLVQHLGSERYGAWALLAQVLSYFSLFDFGIRGAVGYWIIHYGARGEVDRARDVVPTAFWLLVPVSCTLGLAGIAFAQFAPKLLDLQTLPPTEIMTAMSILSVVIAFALPVGCLEAVLTSRQRFDLANSVEAAYLVVASGALIATVMSGGGLVGASIAQAAAYTFRWLLLRRLVRYVDPALSLGPGRFSRIEVRHLMRLGGRKLVMDVAQLVIRRTDLIIAAVFLDLRAVALFTIGRQIVDQLSAANGAAARVFTPRMTELYSTSKHAELIRAYLSCTNISACISLTATAGVFLFVRPFLSLWVGSDFVEGAFTMRSDVIAQVLILAALPGMIQSGLRQTVFASGQWSFLMLFSTIEAVGNLVLSLALVRPLALVGISLGTFIPATITTGILLPWHASKNHGIPIRTWWSDAVRRPLATVVGAALGSYGLQSYWPILTWWDLVLHSALFVSICGLGDWVWALSASNKSQIEARIKSVVGRQ